MEYCSNFSKNIKFYILVIYIIEKTVKKISKSSFYNRYPYKFNFY